VAIIYFIEESEGIMTPDRVVSECAVVIPIYKEGLSPDEEVSLRRCLEVLGGYQIVFAAASGLNCAKYKSICSAPLLSDEFIHSDDGGPIDANMPVSYEFFDRKFFSGVNAYSALMASGDFYKRFLNYKYILIYQLDAFVFENKLAFWCGQDYDYVGAPVFELRRGASAPARTDFLNGGFSLRKTAVFYKLAKNKLRFNVFLYLLLSKYDALVKKRGAFNFFTRTFLFLATRFLYKVFRIEVNEDFAWSLKIKMGGKIAPFNEALRFSFDSCPEYAYKENGEALPFGCHGWTAYYNRLFWKKFI
jgi:hypothetical protein